MLFIALSSIVFGADLATPNAKATVTVNCPEGYVTCSDVDLILTQTLSGDIIRAHGHTVHTKCKDGISPCRFLGYEFESGDIRIRLWVSGVISIAKKGEGIIFYERGQWQ